MLNHYIPPKPLWMKWWSGSSLRLFRDRYYHENLNIKVGIGLVSQTFSRPLIPPLNTSGTLFCTCQLQTSCPTPQNHLQSFGTLWLIMVKPWTFQIYGKSLTNFWRFFVDSNPTFEFKFETKITWKSLLKCSKLCCKSRYILWPAFPTICYAKWHFDWL